VVIIIAKPQKKKVKFLMLKVMLTFLVLALFYVMIISLIPVTSDMDSSMVKFIGGAVAAKEELSSNFQFYILVFSFMSAMLIPAVLYVKKKK
jgi:NADH:ubiquinone oxidoreductase subunit 6 (subunit J)